MLNDNEQDILQAIHSPNELADILEDNITDAELLQNNEESVVLLLTTQNKGKWVYKFHQKASIEALFYQQATSDLLPECRVILNETRKNALLLRYIEGAKLASLNAQQDKLIQYANDITSQISKIQNLPDLQRFNTIEHWFGYINNNFEHIDQIEQQGFFQKINKDLINILKDHVRKTDWQVVLDAPCGLINCDLHNDNIFLLPDYTWKIIDWEQPCLGPLSVDMAGLLENLGIDPYRHMPCEAVKMMNLVKLFQLTHDFANKPEKVRIQDERLVFLRLSGAINRA